MDSHSQAKKALVWLGGAYHLLIVTIAKGFIGLFVPWTAYCPYGPSKSTFGTPFVVLHWFDQC